MSVLFFVSFVGFLSFIYLLRALRPTHKRCSNSLPQGPPGLPILGHLHMMGDLPHRTLSKWAQKYGPIMQLQFGLVPVIVVSSAEMAELFFKTHDLNLSNKIKTQLSQSTTHIKEAMLFVQKLKNAAERHIVVDIGAEVKSMIEKISCRMILGCEGHEETLAIKSMIEECLNLGTCFNINDYLSFMKALIFQPLILREKDVTQKLDEFMEKMISEHEEDIITPHENPKDYASVLMSMIKDKSNRRNIKIVLSDLLGSSWETIAATIWWALKELVRHPEVLRHVQEELANVVGMDRMVQESDCVKLKYLHMVVKEVMRLYPFGPLVPRGSAEDTTVKQFHIPKKSWVIFNVWAIARDPNVWSENAEEFYPERFNNVDIDVNGHNYQVLPFGAGRRKCPGVELALRTIHFALAQLLHCFSLRLPQGMSLEDVDIKERFFAKPSPLFVVPTYRLRM